jgi:hypothetical protein
MDGQGEARLHRSMATPTIHILEIAEVNYQVTKNAFEKFRQAIDEFDKLNSVNNLSILKQAERDGMVSIRDELLEQMRAYEAANGLPLS